MLAPRVGFKLRFFFFKQKTAYEIGLGIPAEPLFRSHVFCKLFNWRRLRTRRPKLGSTLPVGSVRIKCTARSEERFSRNAETDLVCRLLLEKKKKRALIPRSQQLSTTTCSIHRPNTGYVIQTSA